jgi:dynein heavy chain
VSKAAFGLCSWIGAVEAYDRAAKIVASKVAALKATEAEYNEIMGQFSIAEWDSCGSCKSTGMEYSRSA